MVLWCFAFHAVLSGFKRFAYGVRVVCSRTCLAGALMVIAVALVRGNQTTGAESSSPGSLRAHYDAAQNEQAAGQLPLAAVEYRLFLAEALHRLGNGYGGSKDFARALPLFAEALDFAPNDAALRLDYAEAALSAKDAPQARALAQSAVDTDASNVRAHVVLGRALLALQEKELAKSQFEAAVALEPSFANGYLLASTELALQDDKGAGKIFREMLQGFGDTAEIHLQFGQAYATSDYPELAIVEFKKAIAKDDSLAHAHYSLGAAYMQNMGEMSYPDAAQEFQKELRKRPDDFLSHLELGSIELSQHRLAEAETELTQAEKLAPAYPDTLLYLAQVYLETDRGREAEAYLRKVIALPPDDSGNQHQLQRAHYLLGRLLLQSGRGEEAKKEMQAAQTLQNMSAQERRGKVPKRLGMENGDAPPEQPEKMASADPQALQNIQVFEKEIRPAVADSYNNLGVIAAGKGDFDGALATFQKAAEWNPALDGLDLNWGRAAFSANRFDLAVAPLGRHLKSRPDDEWGREALGMSYFMLKNYSASLATFQPMKSQLNASPQLAYAYAVCLTKIGEYAEGVAALQQLEKANPDVAVVHSALGEAYAGHSAYPEATDEFRKALAIDPANEDAKIGLALSLKGLHKEAAAEKPN
jgi:tetratricopeptide (TPR) repeat protein